MCGIAGILNESREAAPDLYIALFAQQHRGKESARIVTFDGRHFYNRGGMGEIPALFRGETLKEIPGTTGIAHNRYSTTSSSDPDNIQPIREVWRGEEFWLAHNGNLINTSEIRKECFKKGKQPATSSDTGAIATLISLSRAPSFEEAVKETVSKLKGAFSIVILKGDELVVLRDNRGFRPLHIGKKGNDWLVASETCVFSHLKATPLRDIDPGEILIIKKSGIEEYYHPPVGKCSHCIFEYIYFERPDSIEKGRRITEVRRNMGRLLAKECPVSGGLPIPIPDSGLYGGLGFIQESNLENNGRGLFRPHSFSRTFIEPVQALRDRGIQLKFVILKEEVKGKVIILIDDSTVRGNTQKKLIKEFRDAEAATIYVRIHSPPYLFPCYYGIDTYRVKDELLAVRCNGSIEKMRQEIGADSLGHLSIKSVMMAIIQTPGEPLKEEDFCTACFTGNYPIEIPAEVLNS